MPQMGRQLWDLGSAGRDNDPLSAVSLPLLSLGQRLTVLLWPWEWVETSCSVWASPEQRGPHWNWT